MDLVHNFTPVHCINVITLAKIYSTRKRSYLTYKYDQVASEQSKLVVCRCVCVCTRMCVHVHVDTGLQKFGFFQIDRDHDRG